MRRVKIVCTIGPASSSEDVIHRMIKAGMNIARLNLSHGTRSEHKRAVNIIRAGARKYKSPVAILLDLKGLRLRVGPIRGGSLMLKRGTTLTLTSKTTEGNSREVSISHPHLLRHLRKGDRILIDDGLLRLRVVRKERGRVVTKVIEGGVLKEGKGINLPGIRIPGRVFTEQDRRDLEFGIKIGVDYVAMSFVRSKDDILDVKRHLRRMGVDVPVIAKIEKPQALENIDEIIRVSDGLMIARGDLGVEVSPEEVPLIQKELIEKCNRMMKPVITATQMLESMTAHTRPTRAEAADVANAVLDGTDALMLSAETAIGKYPVETLRMMDRIIRFTEGHKLKGHHDDLFGSKTFAHAIAEAACVSARDIEARAIVAFTRTGFTALLLSKLRPDVPIIAFTPNEAVRRRMSLYWGVTPYVMRFPEDTDRMISRSEKALLREGIVKRNDPITIIATSPFAPGGRTNIMKLHRVGI
jgi:pyruvate kinase